MSIAKTKAKGIDVLTSKVVTGKLGSKSILRSISDNKDQKSGSMHIEKGCMNKNIQKSLTKATETIFPLNRINNMLKEPPGVGLVV